MFNVVLSIVTILFSMGQPSNPNTPVVINPNATNPYINTYGKPGISAHRSGAGLAPENTLMAFETCVNAKDFSIDTFECDVNITKDGELVLLHDYIYDNVSNAVEAFGRPAIMPGDYTYQQLHDNLNLGAKFQDGQPNYAKLRGKDIPENLRVLRLQDILDYTESHTRAGKPWRYTIEIKSLGTAGYRAADKLYEILAARGMLERVVVGTFLPDVSMYISTSHPDMVRSANPFEVLMFYINSRANTDLSGQKLGYSVLQVPYGDTLVDGTMPWGIQVIVNLGTREFINYAHKYNIAVQYWTIDKPEDMRLLRDNGADAIMTNWPSVAWETLH
jgi:glycerophosphoryl diester phosphodiesterase